MGEGTASREPCGPHTMCCRAEGARAAMWWGPCGPPPSLLWSPCRVGENRDLTFRFVNSENVSCVTFLKAKKAENRQMALWHLVNRLVPGNAIKC